MSPEEFDRVIAINVRGVYNGVVTFAPGMRARGRGHIVNTASVNGLLAHATFAAYSASKFGLVGFTRALILELAGRVGVTLLIPGGMQTAFFDDRDPQYKPGPDAKLNRPEDVAAAVLFALSQPPGCEIRELVVTPSTEPSWP